MKKHFHGQSQVRSSDHNPKATEASASLQRLLCSLCFATTVLLQLFFFLRKEGFKKEQAHAVDRDNKKQKAGNHKNIEASP